LAPAISGYDGLPLSQKIGNHWNQHVIEMKYFCDAVCIWFTQVYEVLAILTEDGGT
jgi:hypothetical protein